MSLDGPYQAQREAEHASIVEKIYECIESQGIDILEPIFDEATTYGFYEVKTEYEYDKDDFRLDVLMALEKVMKEEIGRLVGI